MASIKVFNHWFKKSEIIGIGPLMYRDPRDTTQAALYNARQLFFLLHCKGHSVEIHSDWFELGHAEHQTDHHRNQKLAYMKCRQDYDALVADILDFLAESEEQRKPVRSRKAVNA